MDVVLMVVATLLVIAGFSAGSALGLHLAAPHWQANKRIGLSALLATILPMSLPLGGFALEADIADSGDWALGLTALLVTTLLVLTMVALPSAWLVTRKLEGGEGHPELPGAEDEPEALPEA